MFDDPNREKLARKLLLNSKSGLDKLFLVGSSGAEACDAAMKLSYQYFYNLGKKNKRIFYIQEAILSWLYIRPFISK